MAITSPQRRARQILIWLGSAERHLAHRVNRALAGGEVPFAQFVILDHLASLPGRSWTVSSLAEALEIGQPGVSKILRRLAAKGLVEIAPDPADRRVRRVALTTDGRAAHRNAADRVAPLAADAFAGWAAADIESLHHLLRRLKSSLRD